jgi:hypothetical protein
MVETASDASDELSLTALASGVLHRFTDWPNPDVPAAAFGVYSVWLPDGKLLYVGMSGRAMKVDPESLKRRGLWTRLGSLSLDALTKQYVHEFLSYRFVVTSDSADAYRLERLVQSGALSAGKPILNPR